MSQVIASKNELEFVVFCIENLAVALHTDAQSVYRALTEKSDILKSYIVRNMRCFTRKVKNIMWMISWKS